MFHLLKKESRKLIPFSVKHTVNLYNSHHFGKIKQNKICFFLLLQNNSTFEQVPFKVTKERVGQDSPHFWPSASESPGFLGPFPDALYCCFQEIFSSYFSSAVPPTFSSLFLSLSTSDSWPQISPIRGFASKSPSSSHQMEPFHPQI